MPAGPIPSRFGPAGPRSQQKNARAKGPVPRILGTIVFAGPDYDARADQRLAKAQELLRGQGRAAAPVLRGASLVDTRGLRWRPLPGAAAEAEDVKQTLKSSRYRPVRTYVGGEALEEIFKTMPAPRLLHIATHGFFLPDKPPEPAAPADGAARGDAGSASGLARLRQMRNPLLRSGIVLAGANAAAEPSANARVQDGYVTAEEITLMDLHGTELVVLSACETGLGDIRAGEGVYGLRHAFLYAGARSLITSLFEVPDAETRAMMKRFYDGLDGGRDKLLALHEAQLAMISQRRRDHEAAHPFFWASFVLVGDPK